MTGAKGNTDRKGSLGSRPGCDTDTFVLPPPAQLIPPTPYVGVGERRRSENTELLGPQSAFSAPFQLGGVQLGPGGLVGLRGCEGRRGERKGKGPCGGLALMDDLSYQGAPSPWPLWFDKAPLGASRIGRTQLSTHFHQRSWKAQQLLLSLHPSPPQLDATTPTPPLPLPTYTPTFPLHPRRLFSVRGPYARRGAGLAEAEGGTSHEEGRWGSARGEWRCEGRRMRLRESVKGTGQGGGDGEG